MKITQFGNFYLILPGLHDRNLLSTALRALHPVDFFHHILCMEKHIFSRAIEMLALHRFLHIPNEPNELKL